MKPEELELMEYRKFLVDKICRVYRVPLDAIAAPNRFNSSRQEENELLLRLVRYSG